MVLHQQREALAGLHAGIAQRLRHALSVVPQGAEAADFLGESAIGPDVHEGQYIRVRMFGCLPGDQIGENALVTHVCDLPLLSLCSGAARCPPGSPRGAAPLSAKAA